MFSRSPLPTLFSDPTQDAIGKSMSKAAQSIFYFGVYAVALGASGLITPDFIADVFRIDRPADSWARFTGAVAIWLGIYYLVCGRNEVRSFFYATVVLRPLVLMTLIVFVMLGWFKPGILMIGVIDTLGAAWTWWALHQNNRIGRSNWLAQK